MYNCISPLNVALIAAVSQSLSICLFFYNRSRVRSRAPPLSGWPSTLSLSIALLTAVGVSIGSLALDSYSIQGRTILLFDFGIQLDDIMFTNSSIIGSISECLEYSSHRTDFFIHSLILLAGLCGNSYVELKTGNFGCPYIRSRGKFTRLIHCCG